MYLYVPVCHSYVHTYVHTCTCTLLVLVTFQRQPWHLGSCCVPTLDLWLNFDSSICIIAPGPPNCGIGWRSNASHATSRHFRANLTKTFRDAIPSISITFKESLCGHFQRKCKCLPKEILLVAKYEFALTEEARLHRRHLLSKFSKYIYWLKFFIFSKHRAGKIWLNTHQMYPSTLCRWRVSRIALRQFTQLTLLFKSLLLCNQFITRSLFPLLIPNIRGPSSSRKKLGIPGSVTFT